MSVYIKNPENIRLEDGKLYGVEMSGAFNVQLAKGGNPQVHPTITIEGMPITDILNMYFDAWKVKSRAATLKSMTVEELEKFTGKVRRAEEYLSKRTQRVVAIEVKFDELSPEEQQKYIKELQARVKND